MNRTHVIKMTTLNDELWIHDRFLIAYIAYYAAFVEVIDW